jgi:hypothetical protein
VEISLEVSLSVLGVVECSQLELLDFSQVVGHRVTKVEIVLDLDVGSLTQLLCSLSVPLEPKLNCKDQLR